MQGSLRITGTAVRAVQLKLQKRLLHYSQGEHLSPSPVATSALRSALTLASKNCDNFPLPVIEVF